MGLNFRNFETKHYKSKVLELSETCKFVKIIFWPYYEKTSTVIYLAPFATVQLFGCEFAGWKI
jgi:hypothetical protein